MQRATLALANEIVSDQGDDYIKSIAGRDVNE
jgi:hypothetical protein